MKRIHVGLVVPIALALASSTLCQAQAPVAPAPVEAGTPSPQRMQWLPVAGTGIHYFSSAVVHSVVPTATGLIQHSTETVDLAGDLSGRLLYQPRSVFDFVAGTLVNTGHQVFSGSVLGSPPVLLHDDTFRFDVDLTTGATLGVVQLEDRIAGPNTRCLLEVVGTGLTADGDATFDYSGMCRLRTVALQDPGTQR